MKNKMMAMPQVPKSSGFGGSLLIGLVFVLVGITFGLVLMGTSLPIDADSIRPALEWGAAIGSILGGFAIMFKKKDV